MIPAEKPFTKVVMKLFFLVSGLVGLGLLSAACSDSNDAPAPFAEDDSLEARLATDLGAPFLVERTGAVAQVISPLGTTKVRTLVCEPESP